MTSLVSQFVAFLVMIGAGLVVGLMFDMYRVIRALTRPRATGSLVMDLLFWVLVTPAFFLMLLAGNWGELRFYVFLGAALGIFVYFQLASSFVLWSMISFARWLGRMLAAVIYTAARLAGMPVAFYREARVSWFQLRGRWRGKLRIPLPRIRRPFGSVPRFRFTPPWGRAWPFGRR